MSSRHNVRRVSAGLLILAAAAAGMVAVAVIEAAREWNTGGFE